MDILSMRQSQPIFLQKIQFKPFLNHYLYNKSSKTLMEIESTQYLPIIPPKSPNDERTYEAVTLKNGLKLLFVHDNTLEKSACSISVGVGSLQDPQRSLGLAHFLEHMLFMGSKKYPIHNEYSSFINQNSGMDNAYTSDLQTNYYFEISNSAFVEAVQRITNFFTGALLTQSCISKQTQAVHEEYMLWTNDDNCRKWEILRKLAKGPYHRFSIGNNETLGHEHIRDDLVKFYESEYSANKVNAVLCSSLTIEEMKKSLVQFFEQIPNKNMQKHKYAPSFEPQNLGHLVRMQSIKEQTVMQFFWPVELLKYHYKKNIDEYITHVLGHEGKNSLLSYLKQKGFASQLSCYHHDIANQTLIGLQVKLTQLGQDNYEQVYNTVIDYTCSMKAEIEVYEQLREKKKVAFQFREKTETYRYVCELSSKMHDIELPEILNHKYLFQNALDKEFLQRVIKQLNPFNCIVVYSSSETLENPITEKYLGAKYLVEKLPQRRVFKQQFSPLAKNPFLPLDTTVKEQNGDKQTPRRIANNILFLKDNKFKVCKGGVRITLHGLNDPVLREFYAEYLQLLLKELTYDAQTLQLTIDYNSQDAIEIQMFGYSDTVLKLVGKIGEELIHVHKGENSQGFFSIAQNKILEDYENFYCDDVDSILEATMDNILRNENHDINVTMHILESYDYSDITKEILDFLSGVKLSWVFVGNFVEEECTKLVKEFQSNLKTTSKLSDEHIKCLKLQNTARHLTELSSEEISTSGCIVYYEAGQYSEKLYYIIQLLKNHVQEPFFNELRTEKQMAYYLTTRIVNTRGVLGLYFILVSSTKDPHFIAAEIKRFVTNFMAKMTDQLTEQKLEKLRQSVKTKFSVPHNNLRSLFEFVCQQISKSTFYFTRKEKAQLESYLNSITLNDLMQTWDKISTKSLELHVLATNHIEEWQGATRVQQYDEFNKIKQGSYYNDWISEKSQSFSPK